MKAQAPGKLILSGEHAVVYGCPALVMAVQRQATATANVVPESTNRSSEPQLSVNAPTILGTGTILLHELPRLFETLNQRHSEFLEGKRDISQILDDDMELAYYAVAMLTSEFFTQSLPQGIHLDISTDIPIGCGMGSSAAILAAILAATATTLGLPKPTPEIWYEWTLAAERLQHGRPSGVDPYIVTHGGCARFQQGKAIPLTITSKAPLSLWVQTGPPAVSTGHCVAAVASRFQSTDAIWQDFTDCTTRLEAAWKANDRSVLEEAIRENHRLLCRIGVVPETVQAFIRDIETLGGCAKICGAGASSGETAGIVGAAGIPCADLHSVCQRYGFELETEPM